MPKYNDFYGLRGFAAMYLMDGEETHYGNATCAVMHNVYAAYKTRMDAYGTAMGCKMYEPLMRMCQCCFT